jgi:hypothetical protein
MSDIPGGTPLTPAEQAIQEQWQSLRRIVDQAFRMLPGGPGQGEGPTPDDVDKIVQTILYLYQVTATLKATGARPALFEWLGISFGVDPAEAEFQAAHAIRDIMLAVGDQSDPGGRNRQEEDADIDLAARAAELFATIAEQPVR